MYNGLHVHYTSNLYVWKIIWFLEVLVYEWYNDMTEQQKRNFKKVIVVCVLGAILILLIPMILKFVL